VPSPAPGQICNQSVASMREDHTYLSNFEAPGLILLPRQTIGAVGRRAGALFFARHRDYFVVTRNFTAIYLDFEPFHSFTVTLGFAALYQDWQKTSHRDTDGT